MYTKSENRSDIFLMPSGLVVIMKMSLLLVLFWELTSFVSLFQGNQILGGLCVFHHYSMVFIVGVFKYLWI